MFSGIVAIGKNNEIGKNNKLLWLMLIIFLPFSALFYPDFRKIQIIID